LVRRVAIAGGADRQHLPDFLSCLGEKLDEIVGRVSKIADAVSARERTDVQENSAAAGKVRGFHDVLEVLPRARVVMAHKIISSVSGKNDEFGGQCRTRTCDLLLVSQLRWSFIEIAVS
jgi:hypothetical protein